MHAATYAKQIGRTVPFALAAFRQAFAGGRALDADTVLIAAAACEMHPAAVLKAIDLRSVRDELARPDGARDRARRPRRPGARRRRARSSTATPVARGRRPRGRRDRGMRAKAVYRLIVGRDTSRSSTSPTARRSCCGTSARARCPRFARRLREELNTLPADEFLERWTAVVGPDDL